MHQYNRIDTENVWQTEPELAPWRRRGKDKIGEYGLYYGESAELGQSKLRFYMVFRVILATGSPLSTC